jgi:trehalose 6-phosphate synthase
MSRVVIVSNRLDLPPGDRAPGGLAVSLAATLRGTGSLWFGWSGRVEPACAAPRRENRDGIEYAVIDLSPSEHDDYYHGFCNRVLWPLSHGQAVDTAATAAWFRAYLTFNARVAAQLSPLLDANDVVWAQDYHLLPLAHYLRSNGCRNRLGHFLHVPFPALDQCAEGEELLEKMLAYDLLGFQTPRDLATFESLVRQRRGAGVLRKEAVQAADGRWVATGVFPLGIEVDTVRAAAVVNAAAAESRWWSSRPPAARLVGADRLDVSKGLLQRLGAVRHYLAQQPEGQPLPEYLQLVTPSRTELPAHRDLLGSLQLEVQRTAQRLPVSAPNPVRCVFNAVERDELMGILATADVGLVTPLMDGMNLLAKEFVAAQPAEDPGVLVLSKSAGAAMELDAALLVDPEDTIAIAAAIDLALRMSLEERHERHQASMKALRRNELPTWHARFLERLRTIESRGPHSA